MCGYNPLVQRHFDPYKEEILEHIWQRYKVMSLSKARLCIHLSPLKKENN